MEVMPKCPICNRDIDVSRRHKLDDITCLVKYSYFYCYSCDVEFDIDDKEKYKKKRGLDA